MIKETAEIIALMELLDEAEEKYNDFLNKLDITEKELYEYMKELYNENFI